MNKKSIAALAAAISATATTLIETLVIGRTLLESLTKLLG